uniref:Protein N-terminal glutamine amidohydrolase n=1 Tax=Magallana gigas TaxID=29159 RepID=K1QV58_MAGGI
MNAKLHTYNLLSTIPESLNSISYTVKEEIPGQADPLKFAKTLTVNNMDYHVIFLYQTSASGTLVYDLDTTLTFPCDLKQYYEEAIKDNKSLKPEYHRMFRVIPAAEYLKTFASDRLHMLTPDGRWKAPPPLYPPIKTEGTNTIPEC